jgi:ribosome biogenesis GTPase A
MKGFVLFKISYSYHVQLYIINMKLVTIELNIYYEEGIDTPIKSSVVGLISNTSMHETKEIHLVNLISTSFKGLSSYNTFNISPGKQAYLCSINDFWASRLKFLARTN